PVMAALGPDPRINPAIADPHHTLRTMQPQSATSQRGITRRVITRADQVRWEVNTFTPARALDPPSSAYRQVGHGRPRASCAAQVWTRTVPAPAMHTARPPQR